MAEICEKTPLETFRKKHTNLPVPYSYFDKQGFFRGGWLTWLGLNICNNKVMVVTVYQSKINNTFH